MKKTFLVLILLFIFGLSCGGIYQLLLGSGEIAVPAFVEDIIHNMDNKSEKSNSSNSDSDERDNSQKAGAIDENKSSSSSENKSSSLGSVTNPNKKCSNPDCDKPVFVNYKGRDICVYCYTKEKNADTAK